MAGLVMVHNNGRHCTLALCCMKSCPAPLFFFLKAYYYREWHIVMRKKKREEEVSNLVSEKSKNKGKKGSKANGATAASEAPSSFSNVNLPPSAAIPG